MTLTTIANEVKKVIIRESQSYIFTSRNEEQVEVWIDRQGGKVYLLLEINGAETEAVILEGANNKSVSTFADRFDATIIASYLDSKYGIY